MTSYRVVPATPMTAAERRQQVGATVSAMKRAGLHGWGVVEGPRDAFFVPSASRVRTARCVEVAVGADGLLWFGCTCEGAYYNPENLISCWHGAAVARHLFAQGKAFPDGGLFRLRRPEDRLRDAHGRFVRLPKRTAS